MEKYKKHRYVYLRGKKWLRNLMYKEIEKRVQEYPQNSRQV